MQKITPSLWFDTEAEEAARFYTSKFKDSKILAVTHYGEAGPPAGGHGHDGDLRAGGPAVRRPQRRPEFSFTEAVSLQVNWRTQEEIDTFWAGLRRRRGGAMRLAEGPVRPVLADRADDPGRADQRSGHREGAAGDGGDAADAQARHRGAAAGCRAILTRSTPSGDLVVMSPGGEGFRNVLAPGHRSPVVRKGIWMKKVLFSVATAALLGAGLVLPTGGAVSAGSAGGTARATRGPTFGGTPAP